MARDVLHSVDLEMTILAITLVQKMGKGSVRKDGPVNIVLNVSLLIKKEVSKCSTC